MKLRFLKDRDEEEKASNFLDFKTEERANSFKEKGIYDKLIQDEKDIILREREENDAQSSITDEELSKFSEGNIMGKIYRELLIEFCLKYNIEKFPRYYNTEVKNMNEYTTEILEIEIPDYIHPKFTKKELDSLTETKEYGIKYRIGLWLRAFALYNDNNPNEKLDTRCISCGDTVLEFVTEYSKNI